MSPESSSPALRNPRLERQEKAIKDAIRKAPTTVGADLSNSARILRIEEIQRYDHGVEYCLLAVASGGGYQPFIVWNYMVGITQLADGQNFSPVSPYCYNGSYHRELEDAMKDFEQYVERNSFGPS